MRASGLKVCSQTSGQEALENTTPPRVWESYISAQLVSYACALRAVAEANEVSTVDVVFNATLTLLFLVSCLCPIFSRQACHVAGFPIPAPSIDITCLQYA